MNKPLPPDQAARDRAVADLTTNLLVEAGAGSGKTTLMADRIVAMVKAKYPADQIAAVTFTRKAASELRERVQLKLEKAHEAPERANEIFIGTIHSFCARLLRERPVEAGLDPRFRELDEIESQSLAETFWASWIERLFVSDHPLLRRLREVDVQPTRLHDAFLTFVTYPDVEFPSPDCPAPAIGDLVAQLKAFIARGVSLMPSEPPAAGWDDVQNQLWRLHFEQRARDWSRPADFFDSLVHLGESSPFTQNRWVRDESQATAQKRTAKVFVEELQQWRCGPAAEALTQWHEHCYAPVVAVASEAAAAFAKYRMATSRLSFEDLLLLAARLLRNDAGARTALGERWRYVLVDEFQDTDPVQAEVLFLLASASDSGTDWSRVTLRDAALFVVGDPKQSIYRFRRADIETYQAARRIIEQQGAVLQLTANFRSLPAIATFVNTHFGERGAFPKKATPEQAAFARLEPAREDVNSPASVERYEVSAPSRAAGKAVVIALDAAQIATWVADAITNNEAKAGDVMVLSRKKEALAEIARQLSARGVPVAVTGAAVTLQAELQELSVVLQLMRDPNNPVLVVAALEGRFFGCSPADLWAAREASITFTVVTPPSPVPDDARALRVHEALTCLHRWLLQAHRDAPDVFLSRILAETGLLAWTASDELGDVRAGLLLRLVEEVRKASLDPETAGDAAYNALETLISNELPDAPLLPGRTDAVRVMNLHKAKGLEAKIVILAAPLEKTDFPPRVAVRRKEGRAIGAVQVVVKEGFQYRVIAQPAGWAQWQQDEAAFQNAEEERLRYVAATRACDRLLISEFVLLKKDDAERKNDREWSAFSPTLDALKIAARPMPIDDAAGRAVLQESPETVMQQAADADARRVQAAASSWAWKTVTGSAKAEYQARVALEDVSVAGRGAGAAWGRAVHRALEEAGRMGLPDVSKASALRFASEEHIPEQAEALHDVVNSVLCGPQWQVIAAAPARRFEWPVAGWKKLDGVPTYLEGVIDAAYQTPDGWHLIDWKTDDVDDAEWMRRLEAYHRQLTTYAELLAVATGGSVTHEIVRVR